MATTPINTLNPTSLPAAATPSGSSQSVSSATDGLANEQTFLKLFVAQLQHQDPLQPQDPTQFIAQLAQFSGLEQSLQMRQDLDAILKTLQSNSGGNSATPKT